MDLLSYGTNDWFIFAASDPVEVTEVCLLNIRLSVLWHKYASKITHICRNVNINKIFKAITKLESNQMPPRLTVSARSNFQL